MQLAAHDGEVVPRARVPVVVRPVDPQLFAARRAGSVRSAAATDAAAFVAYDGFRACADAMRPPAREASEVTDASWYAEENSMIPKTISRTSGKTTTRLDERRPALASSPDMGAETAQERGPRGATLRHANPSSGAQRVQSAASRGPWLCIGGTGR